MIDPFTVTGFKKPTVPELRADLQAKIIAVFGSVSFEPNDVFGQLVEVFIPEYEKVWGAIERIYQSLDPDFAEGAAQDATYNLVAVRRLEPLATRVDALIWGTEGTILDGTRSARTTNTQQTYNVAQPATITRLNVIRVWFSFGEVVGETPYSVFVDGIEYTYTSEVDDTIQDIIDGLLLELNAIDGYTAIEIADDQIELTKDGFLVPFSFNSGTNTAIERIYSPCVFVADTLGPIPCPSFALDDILTPVSGWDGVINLLVGTIGRNTESNPDFRARRQQSLRITGGGTFDAMKARLKQEVAGVTGVTILQNRTGTTDLDGRPGHSYECLVAGGDDQDIRDKIWELGPLGIQTHGNIEGTITDSQGETQVVNFSRATQVYIWIRITLELYDEETFPLDGLDQVKNNVFNYGLTLDPGNDVLVGRFNAPIYLVPGIRKPTIELAKTSAPDGAPTYAEDDLAISGSEQAVFDLVRITVT